MIGALAGCTADGTGGLVYNTGPDTFGEANRQTMAAQIVDPAPVYETASAAGSGEHAAQAIERYRTDKVKKPEKLRTSNGIAGGGGGGGSSGSD
jgi:type IV pilus biogenesis protein CpaD/CtpE